MIPIHPPYKGVRGKGKVGIHNDINHNMPIAEKIMVGYLRSLAHPMATSLMNSVKNGGFNCLGDYDNLLFYMRL